LKQNIEVVSCVYYTCTDVLALFLRIYFVSCKLHCRWTPNCIHSTLVALLLSNLFSFELKIIIYFGFPALFLPHKFILYSRLMSEYWLLIIQLIKLISPKKTVLPHITHILQKLELLYYHHTFINYSKTTRKSKAEQLKPRKITNIIIHISLSVVVGSRMTTFRALYR